jgi:hypothetical protein
MGLRSCLRSVIAKARPPERDYGCGPGRVDQGRLITYGLPRGPPDNPRYRRPSGKCLPSYEKGHSRIQKGTTDID